ncbi:MAG: sigma-54 dependent transcriptional regulator [Planctomycetia bacterium]|nr:sigma-54 dependent transcriptional regulator [Planctomycetia bacterium]
MASARLFIFDADRARAAAYETALANLEPTELVVEADLKRARALLTTESFDGAILAVATEQGSELELLTAARSLDPAFAAVVVCRKPTAENAVAALKLGVVEYLTEPVDGSSLSDEQLAGAVERMLRSRRIGAENALLRRQVERPYVFDDMIGTCPAMRKVFDVIAQVADSGVDCLIHGETGTGKELVARSIHTRSRRAEKPFVPVDCGAIPENLLESEFFGHERGAYTGADRREIGLLEFADGGTFFLDELGELPLLLQAKLLRTLQERRIRRVGGRAEIPVDLRIVAATARKLEEMVDEGKFRRDLYYRINVVRIELPPLRNRGDDLGLLAERFAAKYSREMGRTIHGISPEAYQVMSQYAWPGNVRELQNVVRRAIALSTDTLLGPDDLPDALVA